MSWLSGWKKRKKITIDHTNVGGDGLVAHYKMNDGTDLIGHWKFNDNAANTTVADSYGSNDGTASSNTDTMSVAAKINDGFYLDSSANESIDFGSPAALDIDGKSFTWSMWVKPTAQSDDAFLVNKRTYISRDRGDNDTFYAAIRAGGVWKSEISVQCPSTWDGNTWYHVTLTVEDQGAYVLYVYDANGNQVGTDSGSLGADSVSDSDANNLIVGRRGWWAVQDDELDATVDDFRVYGSVLTQDEVESIVNGGNGTEIGTGLVGDSKGSNAGTYKDSGGNINTSTGSVAGKINDALDFDGNDEYVDCGTANELGGMSELTIACWVKTPLVGRALTKVHSYQLWAGSDSVNGYLYTNSGWTSFFHSHSVGSLGANQWHHIAVVTNGTYVRTYIDGGDEVESIINETLNIDTNTNLYFGGRDDGTGYPVTNMYEGQMDDVRIYNKGLSSDEVSNIYNSGSGTEAEVSNLQHYPLPITLGTSVGQNNEDASAVFDELTSDADRKKIAVTKDDGTTQLYVEIEKWDTTNQKAVLWVSKSDWSISGASDTDIYLYYDSTEADNTTYVADAGSRTEVWDGDTKGRWGLAEDPSGGAPQMIDSTSNNNDGTSNGSMTSGDQVAGKLDGSLDFDGANDYINIANTPSSLQGDITVSAWLYPNFSQADGSTYQAISLEIDVSNRILFYKYQNDFFGVDYEANTSANYLGGNMTQNAWHHLVFVKSGDSLELFINGTSVATGTETNSMSATTPDTNIGVQVVGGTSHWDGQVDDVRVSATGRSTAWAKATYYAQDDNILDWFAEEISWSFASKNTTSPSNEPKHNTSWDFKNKS